MGKDGVLNLTRNALSFIKVTFLDALRTIRSRERVKSIYGVSLYRNAVYLIANSGTTAALGFVFWIVVARLYSPADVGLGSALLSVSQLLSLIGTLGLGFGIIRFLPDSRDKPRLLNSSLTLSLFTAVIVTLLFIVGLPFWSPKLIFVRENPAFLGAFVVFIVAAALSRIAAQVFIAFRRAGFALASAVIVGLLRLALAVGFASVFKVFGIFASWGSAVAVSLMVCLFLFLPRVLPVYRPIPSLQRQVSNDLVHFSLANYISETLWSLPAWILPLMVVNILSPEATAYFYISWTMASLLLAIALGASLSLFAEGSHMEERLGNDLRRSIKFTALLLIPAIIILVFFGDKLLLLFGREYSVEGAQLLWLLAAAALPASVNFLYLGVARVKKKLKEIILITGAIAFGTLILSYLLLPHFGILGAGIGWLATQIAVALVLVLKLIRSLGKSND